MTTPLYMFQNLKMTSIANWNWLLRVPFAYANRSRA